MKAVNIVLLVLAGALSGALIMKVAQPNRRMTMRPSVMQPVQVAQAQTPPPEPKPSPLAPDAGQAPEVAQASNAGQAADVAEAPNAGQGSNPGQATKEAAPPNARDAANATQAARVAAAPNAPETVTPSWSPAERHAKLRAPHTPPRMVRMTTPSAAAPPAKPAPQTISRPVAPPDRPEIAIAAPAPAKTSPTNPPPALPEQPKETPPARMEQENATPASAPSAPQPNQATLNAGMLIPVRLLDSLSPERNRAGDPFAATLDRELVASGFIIAERGARVEGRVTAVDANARTMSLELTSVHTSDNQDVFIQTQRFDKKDEPDHSNAAAKIGAGAAIGAAIGAVAGGGKGAAIGAGAGGSIGAGDVLLSRRAAVLYSETRLVFRLRAPVVVTERTQ